MKKKFKILVALVLAALMLASTLIPTFAASAEADSEPLGNGVQWRWADEGTALVGDDKKYEEIWIPAGYKVGMWEKYYYHNELEGGSTAKSMSLYTNMNGKNFIVAHNYYTSRYFVDPAIKDDLNLFFDIKNAKSLASKIVGTYYDYTYGDFFMISELYAMLEEYKEQSTAVVVNVVDLYQYSSYKRLRIRAYDPTGSVYTVIGCVYFNNNGAGAYYVDYTALPNSRFDSEGEFSYRTGTVPAAYISSSSELYKTINEVTAPENVYFSGSDVYHEQVAPPPITNAEYFWGMVLLVLLFMVLVFIGMVVPFVPFVLGILLPRSKKLQKPRGWYAVSAASLVWMISGFLLLVTTTIMMIVASMS